MIAFAIVIFSFDVFIRCLYTIEIIGTQAQAQSLGMNGLYIYVRRVYM